VLEEWVTVNSATTRKFYTYGLANSRACQNYSGQCITISAVCGTHPRRTGGRTPGSLDR
jgi:hypothetical protein